MEKRGTKWVLELDYSSDPESGPATVRDRLRQELDDLTGQFGEIGVGSDTAAEIAVEHGVVSLTSAKAAMQVLFQFGQHITSIEQVAA